MGEEGLDDKRDLSRSGPFWLDLDLIVCLRLLMPIPFDTLGQGDTAAPEAVQRASDGQIDLPTA
jgi:hypothetical protein